MSMNRRQLLQTAGAGWLAAMAPLGSRSLAATQATKKVLFFTKSSGFQHSAITRKGDELGYAERVLTEIGKAHGFDVTATKDGSVFDPGSIDQFDVIAFYTTGDLTKAGTDKQTPMSPSGEKALYDAIKGGKGFVGFHCATDTFGHHRGQGMNDPFIQLIGGEFMGHGAQQIAKIDVIDADFPGASAFGKSFELNDEWYAQRNLANDLHVILLHDTKGMKGKDYERPAYPQTWARPHGAGRVFYTSMGHREDVWDNPKFQGLVLGGLSWASRSVDCDVSPNVSKVAPGYQKETT